MSLAHTDGREQKQGVNEGHVRQKAARSARSSETERVNFKSQNLKSSFDLL